MNRITTFCKLFLLVIVFSLVALTADAQYVTGTVYVDENNNGQFDNHERGIANVIVSNQKDVVLTDENGQFKLELEPGKSLMIVKPKGYELPLNEYNIPIFSYLHEPNGTPLDFEFKGVEPTGPLPEVINFALYPAEEKSEFEALIFADPQPRDDVELTYVRDTFINQSYREEADFIMILGDIMYDDLSHFDRHKNLFSSTGKTLWHIVGNHDLNLDAPNNRHARDTFKNHFGPNYFAFSQGDVTFVALDNVDYKGRGENGRPVYEGRIWGDQLTWLENLLPLIPEDNLVVIASHIPLFAWNGETANVNTLNRDSLFEILHDRQKVVALSGHLHMTYHHYLDSEVGWHGMEKLHQLVTTAVSGTWWGGRPDLNQIPTSTQRDGNPNGYHLFSFDGNNYKETLIGLNHPLNKQIRIEYPTKNISTENIPENLIVNVFNGTERDSVHYRINDGKWTSMTNRPQSSPYYENLLNIHEGYWSSNLRAIPSNHIWESTLNLAGLEGPVKIEIKTVDRYGRQWKEMKVYEYID